MRRMIAAAVAISIVIVILSLMIRRPAARLTERLAARASAAPLPPFADLPADIARMSPITLAALLYVDQAIFTRFSATDTVYSQCDDSMPDELGFVADGRVLEVSWKGAEAHAVVEVVRIGEATALSWDGCTLGDATIDDRIALDTVTLQLQRESGMWRVGYRQSPFVGPIWSDTTIDWERFRTRTDSVRAARGLPPARPRTPIEGHHGISDKPLRYPELRNARCPAGPSPPIGVKYAELEFMDDETPNAARVDGRWWAIYEMRDSSASTCITPVELRVRSEASVRCNDAPTPQIHHDIVVENVTVRPLLLVRFVMGIRTGTQAQYSIVEIPGWSSGVAIYSDVGEVFRVIETSSSGDEGRLKIVFQADTQPIIAFEREQADVWGVYWAGLLNADTIPDLIVRRSTREPYWVSHALKLLLTETDSTGRVRWNHTDDLTVRACRPIPW